MGFACTAAHSKIVITCHISPLRFHVNSYLYVQRVSPVLLIKTAKRREAADQADHLQSHRIACTSRRFLPDSTLISVLGLQIKRPIV